jgi:hypothetical protein
VSGPRPPAWGAGLRDVLLVARFDLGESLRSRRALVTLLLHVAGSVAGAVLFTEFLRQVERAVARQLRVSGTDRPGAMTEALMRTEEVQSVIGGLVGEPDLAADLLQIPPLALFYGAYAMFVVPLLVVITSADSIAAERATGSARYSFFRTLRLWWALGKLVGQAGQLAVGIAVGAVGVFVVGAVQLAGFDPLAHAVWLSRLGGRAWVLGFAWLGVALGISQLTRSVHLARGAGLLALIGGAVAHGGLRSELAERHLGAWADSIATVFPASHRVDLWRPDLVDRGAAALMLLAIGGAAFAVGHARLQRADG